MYNSDNVDYDILFKLILVGDSGVGKTNILSRYINNEYSSNSESTVGVEFSTKMLNKNNKKIKVQIWDTAGQERYKSITSVFYKGAKGGFIVYDITRKDTFNSTDKWINDLKMNGDENISLILIGNKSDLQEQREVSLEDMTKKAELFGVNFCETSALNNTNIDKVFDIVVEDMIKKFDGKNELNNNLNEKNMKGVELNNEKKEEVKKKKCC